MASSPPAGSGWPASGPAARTVLVNHTTVGLNVLARLEQAAADSKLLLLDLFAGVLRCSAASRAMQSMLAVGSPKEFTRLGRKYLSKDVAAALRAAEEAGADAGLLAGIAQDRPLSLTAG